jgi:hypothetical protein
LQPGAKLVVKIKGRFEHGDGPGKPAREQKKV